MSDVIRFFGLVLFASTGPMAIAFGLSGIQAAVILLMAGVGMALRFYGHKEPTHD